MLPLFIIFHFLALRNVEPNIKAHMIQAASKKPGEEVTLTNDFGKRGWDGPTGGPCRDGQV